MNDEADKSRFQFTLSSFIAIVVLGPLLLAATFYIYRYVNYELKTGPRGLEQLERIQNEHRERYQIDESK